MHSQILFPSLIPAAPPLAWPTHPPPQRSRRAPPPSSQSYTLRRMSPHLWRTVRYPPQSVGLCQGMCAFMAGWVYEPAQSLDPHLSCTCHRYCTVTDTGNSAHKHVFVQQRKPQFLLRRLREDGNHMRTRFLSHAQLAHGRIRCARWE